MDLGLRFFIRNECFWIWVFACLYVCWLYLFGFFFIVFFLGFVKPICRARVSKMAQLALKGLNCVIEDVESEGFL